MNNNVSYAVEGKKLFKQFGDFKAVSGVDLKIEKGMVYGFLGPNGAGKTTTIRMLSTLLKIDGGSASIFGYDIATEAEHIRPRIAMTGQSNSIDEDLTGIENLVMISRLMGYSKKEAKSRSEELLQSFGLANAANRQTAKYSGGMRRRLDIAASIVVTHDLLFLDEPTTGLDPRSRNQVWEIIRGLKEIGTTILLTTQYLEEADQLADRIAVINKGTIIAEGTPTELKSSVGSGMLHISVKDINERKKAETILEMNFDSIVYNLSKDTELSIKVDNTSSATKVLNIFEDSDIHLTTFSLSQPSLDEVFLTLTDDE